MGGTGQIIQGLTARGQLQLVIADCTSFVYTIFVRKNITFSAEQTDIELARDEARSQNTTLNDLFRDWLKGIVGRRIRAQEFRALMDQLRYVDAGRKFTRDEMNERR
jgi:hypothetical protein